MTHVAKPNYLKKFLIFFDLWVDFGNIFFEGDALDFLGKTQLFKFFSEITPLNFYLDFKEILQTAAFSKGIPWILFDLSLMFPLLDFKDSNDLFLDQATNWALAQKCALNNN